MTNTYHIVSNAGADLGCYAAETEGDALAQMSIAAGYESAEHAASVAGPFDGRVDECHLYDSAGPADVTSGNQLTPSDLGITVEQYVETLVESFAAGDTGHVTVRGRTVYAA